MEQPSSTLYTGTLAKNVFTKDNEPGLLGLSYSFIPESVQDDSPAVITLTDASKESYRVTHLPPSGDKAIVFDCDEANYDDSEYILVVNHSTKTFTLERREFRVALTNRRWVPVDDLNPAERVLLEGEERDDTINGDAVDGERFPCQPTGSPLNLPSPVASALCDVSDVPTTFLEPQKSFPSTYQITSTPVVSQFRELRTMVAENQRAPSLAPVGPSSNNNVDLPILETNPEAPSLLNGRTAPERAGSSFPPALPGHRKPLALPPGKRGGSPLHPVTPPSNPLTGTAGPEASMTDAVVDDDLEAQLNQDIDDILNASEDLHEYASSSDSSDEEVMELVEVAPHSFRSPKREEKYSSSRPRSSKRTPEISSVPHADRNTPNGPISLKRFLGGEEDEEDALSSSDEE